MLASLIEQYMRLRPLEARAFELRERSRELGESFEELRAAQTELVRKEQLAAVGELSAVVAHEVRNPLAIIANAVADPAQPTLVAPNDRATLLGILDEETGRLNRIVGDLLSYARPVRLERREVMSWSSSSARWCSPSATRRSTSSARTRGTSATSRPTRATAPGVGEPDHQRRAGHARRRQPHRAVAPAEQEGNAGVEVRIEDTGEGMNTAVRKRAQIRSSPPGRAAPASAWPSWPASSTPTAGSWIDSTAGEGTRSRLPPARIAPQRQPPAATCGEARCPMPVELAPRDGVAGRRRRRPAAGRRARRRASSAAS